MAIKLGSAYGKVIIDSSGVVKGVEEGTKSLQGLDDKTTKVGKTMGTFGSRLKSVDLWLRKNALNMVTLGQTMSEAGTRMFKFISIPILGFFALLIKKAIDADTAMGALAKGSIAKLNAQMVELGTKFLPLFIKVIDWLTRMMEKFNNASPATQKTITMLIIGFGFILPIALKLGGILIGVTGILGKLGFTAGVVGTALKVFFGWITATAIPAIVAFVTANAWWIAPLLLVAATVYLVYKAFKTDFGGIATTAKQLWFVLKWVFSGIITAIGSVINAVGKMISAFARIKLPKVLTPGSPTPFELGLRGISAAMDEISRKGLPNLNTGFTSQAAYGMANPILKQNTSSQQSTVFHLANGVTMRDVDRMLDDKIGNFVGRLARKI